MVNPEQLVAEARKIVEQAIADCDPSLRLTHIQWDQVRDFLLMPLASLVAVQREALEFYAQEYGVGAKLASDGGMKARRALAATADPEPRTAPLTAENVANAVASVPEPDVDTGGTAEPCPSVEAELRQGQRLNDWPEGFYWSEVEGRPVYSPQRGDASGEAERGFLGGSLPSSAPTDAPRCTCLWGASGSHRDDCPCATTEATAKRSHPDSDSGDD